MSTALLFDRDRVDEVDDWTAGMPRVGRSAILWIDLADPSDEEVERLIETFDLDPATKGELGDEKDAPRLHDHGSYLHVRAIGLSDANERATARVDCFVAERWLVTVHSEPVAVVEQFRTLAEGSGTVGKLDGLGFLANLLEWALTSYLDAFETLEHDLEEIDAQAMTGRVASADEVLTQLVDRRREVGRLRRALVSHRQVVLALTRPELEAIASSDSAERFGTLRERLEDAVQASRDTRASIVGSFDVLLASTGRRTNEIMKVLTLTSVLLLPGAVIAGVLGMNFKVGIFETAGYFWVAVALIGSLAVATLAVARMREWI